MSLARFSFFKGAPQNFFYLIIKFFPPIVFCLILYQILDRKRIHKFFLSDLLSYISGSHKKTYHKLLKIIFIEGCLTGPQKSFVHVPNFLPCHLEKTSSLESRAPVCLWLFDRTRKIMGSSSGLWTVARYTIPYRLHRLFTGYSKRRIGY